jgi:hypothetical protein
MEVNEVRQCPGFFEEGLRNSRKIFRPESNAEISEKRLVSVSKVTRPEARARIPGPPLLWDFSWLQGGRSHIDCSSTFIAYTKKWSYKPVKWCLVKHWSHIIQGVSKPLAGFQNLKTVKQPCSPEALSTCKNN